MDIRPLFSGHLVPPTGSERTYAESMGDLTWSTPIDRSLLVRDGHVNCPDSATVDVEECLSCGCLLAIEGEHHVRIVCSWPIDLEGRAITELAARRRWSRNR